MDIIKKSGSWFSYEDTKIGQGAEKAKLYLKENPAILTEVEARVKEKASPDLITKLDETEDSAQD